MQSTRSGGVSKPPFSSLNLGRNTDDHSDAVAANTLIFCEAIGITPEQLLCSAQVHGTEILIGTEPGNHSGYDAIITNEPGVFPCIFTADCYPLLLHDPQHHVAAAIHAGWKGTAGMVAMKTIDTMTKKYGTAPERVIATIGAGISGSHYEVSADIAALFPATCSEAQSASPSGKNYLLDLGAANFRQLLEAGLKPEHIERLPYCTFQHHELFYSYRRDHGTTGRMAAVTGLRVT